VFISHTSGEAAQAESNVGFFLLFILKEELKTKIQATQPPKQTKNVVSNIETVSFIMNMYAETCHKFCENSGESCSIQGAQQLFMLRVMKVHSLSPPSTGSTSPRLCQAAPCSGSPANGA
jgi:hypothetical protein